jgi:hypothetical protein
MRRFFHKVHARRRFACGSRRRRNIVLVTLRWLVRLSMKSSSPAPRNAGPLSEQSITVRFVRHAEFLEATMHGFVNPRASSAAVRQVADEARRVGAPRVLIDTGGLIGQLTQSEHAAVGRELATLFGTTRVAGIAPIGRPVGEIAPSARSSGGDYMGFGTRAEALDWLLGS